LYYHLCRDGSHATRRWVFKGFKWWVVLGVDIVLSLKKKMLPRRAKIDLVGNFFSRRCGNFLGGRRLKNIKESASED
jgi:hypothetical protein